MPTNNKTCLTPDMIKVFTTLPNLYLVLAEDLVILAVSNLYLDVVGKTREEIIGRYIYDVFITPSTESNDIHQSLRKITVTSVNPAN